MSNVIHSFGKTDPYAECYDGMGTRTAICGVNVKPEMVSDDIKKVTCKRCLKFYDKRMSPWRPEI